jgi:dTDP-4-amino-4,6-dideoxygalactose transaminase
LEKIIPLNKKHRTVEDSCALLRFPLIFECPEVRDTIHSKLLSAGIGATGLYPVPLNKQEGIPEYLEHNGLYPNAEYVSKRILTLPTHALVSDKDIARTVDTISEEINNRINDGS